MARRISDQTLEQKLAAAELKANALRHQISEQRRQKEARRKIVIGGTILAAMGDDPELRSRVIGLLRQMVTRQLDKEVISDLLDDGEPIARAASEPSAESVAA